jgi:glycolate oxidase FAD binding subunit
VRLSGARAAVATAREKLGGETVDGADDYWRELREHRLPFFDTAAPLWRLSLPSVAAAVEIGGTQLIEWGGAQRWLATTADATLLRETAARLGGHATLFRGGDKAVGVFQPLPVPLRALHERLKQSFDARRVFNPDRLYPGL